MIERTDMDLPRTQQHLPEDTQIEEEELLSHFSLDGLPDLPKVQCMNCGFLILEELCIRYSGCFHAFCPDCFLEHMRSQNLSKQGFATCLVKTCERGQMHTSTALEKVRSLSNGS